jgi:uncharacterized protein DUF3159
MVRGAAGTAGSSELAGELAATPRQSRVTGFSTSHGGGGAAPATPPTFASVLFRGLPGFLREGFLPLAAFYVGWRLAGTVTGIAAATAVSVGLYVYERRAGRDGLLVRIALAFVVVQAAIGLLSGSATVYLATPVVANAVWGLAFLGSAAIGRPLAGALACAWYPFPEEIRRTRTFRRVYGVESIVWGVYLLGRSGLRLLALSAGVGSFVVVTVATGTPLMLGLVAWSIWYAIRKLSDDEETETSG